MALIQTSLESGICGVKWRHFYNKIVNKESIVADIELIFGQLITHDESSVIVVILYLCTRHKKTTCLVRLVC